MSRRRRRSETLPDPIPDAFSSPHRTLTPVVRISARPVDLREIEDRRTYSPQPFRAAKVFSGAVHQPVVVKKTTKFKPQLPFGLTFNAPKDTLICVRRKIRKEVLFAKNKTGAGKRRRKPHKNFYSKIGC